MKQLRSSQGFTLIELVVIILVLGILAVTAIPRFIDLRSQACTGAEQGIAGAVRGGVAVIYASNILAGSGTFPPELDGQGDGTNTAGTQFFSSVLNPGIDDGKWTKTNASPDTYAFLCAGNTVTYKYYASSGEFIK